MHSRSLLFSLAMCMCADMVAADVAAAPSPPSSASASVVVLMPVDPVPREAPRARQAGDKVIRTAEADAPPMPRAQPVTVAARRAPAQATAEEKPRRGTGTTMLLTALAVMFAIALRRLGGADR